MVTFLITSAGVAALLWWRRRGERSPAGARTGPVFLIVAALVVVPCVLRDRLLSGWLLYPLSLFPFDVPWRADDPVQYRLATLGFHRNPADLWHSIDGWSWIGPWLGNRISQWETYEFLGLLIVTIALCATASRVTSSPHRWRAMTLAMAPSLLSVAIWWAATPPSYRFGWGPLFTAVTIPLGWSCWLIATRSRSDRRLPARPVWALALAIPLLIVVVFCALVRLPWWAINEPRMWHAVVSIPYAVAPVRSADVTRQSAGGGLTLLRPTSSDQCWGAYPLCTPDPSPGLAPLESRWEDGFRS